jgi:voltage-gated potassium channel
LDRTLGSTLAERAVIYVTGVALSAVGLGALAMLDAERGASDANIRSFADALWFSATTVATVGYGDRYPVTTEGRLIAVLLMIVGVTLVGTVTASVAAWFVTRTEAEREAEQETDLSERE